MSPSISKMTAWMAMGELRAFESALLSGRFSGSVRSIRSWPRALFCRDVEETRQPVFRGERLNATEECLQALEIVLAFDFYQRVSTAGARVTPALRDNRSLRRGVLCCYQFEAGLCDEPLVFAARHKHVVADGAARRQFLVRDRAVHHQRVAEEQSAAGF